MNKSYRIVFNKSRAAWVVVSEAVKMCRKAGASVLTSTCKKSRICRTLTVLGGGNYNLNIFKLLTLSLLALSPFCASAVDIHVNYDDANENINIGPESNIPPTTTTPDGSVVDTKNAVAIGSDETSAALNSVAIGKQATAKAQGTVAVGPYAGAQGAYSIAVGRESRANGDSSIAIGKESWATKQGTVALGSGAHSTEDRSVAIGDGAQSSGVQSVAVGPASQALSADSVAFGSSSKAEGVEATALGASSLARGKESLAVGNGAEAHNNSDSAVGHNAYAAGGAASAFGFEAHADASKAIAIGNAAYADKEDASAMGAGSKATAEEAMALGTKAEATAKSALAIGAEAKAPAESVIVIGQKANATEGAKFGVALGQKSSVTTEGGVALGANSTANTDKGASGYDPRTGKPYELPEGVDDDPVWQSTAAAVSIGGVGEDGKQITRQITNLAAGTEDTDAVNVAQLKAAKVHYYSVKSDIQGEGSNYENDGATGANALAAGVGAKAEKDGAISVGFNAQAGGTNSIAIGSARPKVETAEDGTETVTYEGSPIAMGNRSIGIGSDVWVYADNGIAIGNMVGAGTNATAVGNNTWANGENSSAYGYDAHAFGANGTAIGASSFVQDTASYGTAVGYRANAQASNSTAVGDTAVVEGNGATYGTAVGYRSTVHGSYATAIGGGQAQALSSLAIGSGSQASGRRSTAVGDGAWTTAESGTSVGRIAMSDGISGTAVGHSAMAHGSSSTAVGATAEVKHNTQYSTAIGDHANIEHDSDYSTVIGSDAHIGWYSDESVAIGRQGTIGNYSSNSVTILGSVYNDTDHAVAVGRYSSVSASYGTAIGASVVESGADNSTAIGTHSVVHSGYEDATAIGGGQAYADQSVAIGLGAVSWGTDSTAVGRGANAHNTESTAVGYGAYGDGYQGTAVGRGAMANAQQATAVGVAAEAKYGAERSTAIGYAANIYGGATEAVAIGNDASIASGASQSVAIGRFATVSQNRTQAVSIGWGAVTDGSQAVAIGKNATIGASSDSSVSIGDTAVTTAPESVAIGFQTTARGTQSVAILGTVDQSITSSVSIGIHSNAKNAYATALGYDSVAEGTYSNAIGYRAHTSGTEATAVGYMAQGLGYQSSAVGWNANAQSNQSTAVGHYATAYAPFSTATGDNAKATNTYATATGYYSSASGSYSTAIGANSGASGMYAIATGVQSQANGSNAISMGTDSQASTSNGLALGTSAKSWSENGIVIGTSSKTSALNGIALGVNAGTWGTNAIGIGTNVNAWREDSIVFGTDSKSGSESGMPGWDPLTGEASTETSSVWVATNNAVSFGRADEFDEDGNLTLSAITRQINNVAAGSLDTDAVNVAQLKAAMGEQSLHFSAEDYVAPIENEDGTTTPAQNLLTKASGGRLPIIGDGEITEENKLDENGQVVNDDDGNPIKIKVRQAGNINTKVTEDIDGTQAIQITLADNLKLGGQGKDGKDGVDGSIGVAGKDGKDGVTIKAEGGQGHIVINGKDGEPGADGQPGEPGPKADITVVQGPAGVNGTDGETLTRIQYIDPKDPDNPHQVATLDDGVMYAGNFDTKASIKLNGETHVVGNLKDDAKQADFIDGNIAVVAEKDGDNAKLALKLNKNLDLQDGSLTIGGGTGDIVIKQGAVSFGGNVITNVASGTEGKLWDDKTEGFEENWNNAANIGDLNQLKQTVTAAHTAVTVGGVKAAETEGQYAKGGNLLLRVDTDEKTEQKTYDLKLADNVTLGGAGTDGKDGVDGSIGVAGKDGKDGVTIKAEDGQGHIVINGKDGEPGADGKPGEPGPKADITVVQGPAGVNGIDGQDGITRIQYKDSDGQPHDVATLEDGMKYAGNFDADGKISDKGVPVKLNKQVDVIGDLSELKDTIKAEDFVDGNIAVVAKQDGENAQLVLKMNKNLALKDGSIKIEGDASHGPIVIKQGETSFGGNIIHHVAQGVEDDDVVNVSQLKTYVKDNTKVEHTFHADRVINGNTGKGAVLNNEGDLHILSNDKYLTTYVDPANNTIKVGFNADQLGTLPAYTGVHYFSYNSAKNLGNYHNESAVGVDSMAIGPDAKAEVERGVAVGYGSVSNTASGIKGYVIEGFTNEPSTKVDGSPTWVATAGAFSVGASGTGVDSVITRQITNVAAGTALTDAVNVAQLKLLKDYVDDKVNDVGSSGVGGMEYGADSGDPVALKANEKLTIAGDKKNISTKIEAGSDGKSATVKVQLNKDIQVNTVNVGGNVKIDKHGFTIGATGPNQIQISEKNISMGGKQIHNVAPGTAGTDAVNLNQLNANNRQIFNKINDVDKNARAGIAQALATAGLPQAYLPGKSMMAAAAGTYDGESGIAIGISSISDDGKWVIKGTASGNTQGKFGGSIGVGYLF